MKDAQKRTLRIFIASSTENLHIAKGLSQILNNTQKEGFRIVPISWDQGTFKLSDTYIESLEKAMDQSDFSVMILTPNDITYIRDMDVKTPRDNVLFELGLFMGRLQRKRCFMLYEVDEVPKLPTDLLGVAAATYKKTEPDQLERALEPACKKILDRIFEVLEEEKLNSFIAGIEGHWWELIQTKTGTEISFFSIYPEDQYRSVLMRGDHFNDEGMLIGRWNSVLVGIHENQKKLIYQWEGDHPPTQAGNASVVQGFGSLEFDQGTGHIGEGKGGFMDVDPNTIVTAQWKTVRLKRAVNTSDINIMTKGSFKDKQLVAYRNLENW